jgi:TetR/AcrR family transcriptional regulator, transcriptional repressor for nem operon
MWYSAKQKIRVRHRITRMASNLLCEKGLDGVHVVGSMKLAGLTHGGFYAHFESRQALILNALALAMDRTASRWRKLVKQEAAPNRFNAIVDAYLGPEHRSNLARGCPLPALGHGIAHSGTEARRTFARDLLKMVDLLAAQISAVPADEARQLATSAIATMVGSLVLARSVDEEGFSNDILEAGRRVLRRTVSSRDGATCRLRDAQIAGQDLRSEGGPPVEILKDKNSPE